MTPLELAEEIINGRRIKRQDDLTFFLNCDLDELCEGADRIRKHFVGDKVDLCSIINGRSGKCPEDCKYCAQSAHNHTDCEVYDFLPEEDIVKACTAAHETNLPQNTLLHQAVQHRENRAFLPFTVNTGFHDFRLCHRVIRLPKNFHDLLFAFCQMHVGIPRFKNCLHFYSIRLSAKCQ